MKRIVKLNQGAVLTIITAGIFSLVGCQTARIEKGSQAKVAIVPQQIGFVVYDLEAKKPMVEQNADLKFIPASVGKIPAVLAALNILGPEHRFKTTLAFDGTRRGATLVGDVYLKGGGDPFLTLSDLMGIAQALKRTGISSIMGDFYYDESLFVPQTEIDLSMDKDASFNPGISSLSTDFNLFYVLGKMTSRKDTFQTIPAISFLDVVESHRAGPIGTYMKGPESEIWAVDGRSVGRSRKLPIKQAALYTANLFRYFASLEGLQLPDPKPGTLPKKAKTIFQHQSEPLLKLAERVFEFSNNLMAELLQLSAASKLSGKLVTQESAAQEVFNYYQKQIPEQDWRGFEYHRGSGDSIPTMTPKQLLAFLKWGDGKVFSGRSLMSLLPISGWKGSLAGRLESPATSLRVWAKTGTMSFAVSLAGYFYGLSGKKYLFVIFCNDLEKRKAYETAPDKVGNLQGSPSEWTLQAREVVDAYLEYWATHL